MTKAQLTQAMRQAEADSKAGKPFDHEAMDILCGCALPEFEPVTCTLNAVANLVRWQAHRFDGTWDEQEINDIANIGRRKFNIVGD